MNRKIFNWTLGYELGRFYISLAQTLFYSKIIVKGLQNIPSGKRVIFAPNHQNAILDALAVACSNRKQVVFMARADVFNNNLFSRVLRFMKIMPVYRIRDGYENLIKNEKIFGEAIEVLQHNEFLCLMPEGTHGDKHQLQPLIKGIFRIAFMAIEKNLDNPPVIIPVGIDYSSYYPFRSQLVVQYGKPIVVADFYELYKKSPPLAINSLRISLTEEMKKLMINIDCGGFYEDIDFLRALLRPLVFKNMENEGHSAYNRFLADKWFVEKCNEIYYSKPEIFNNISIEANEIKQELVQFNISCEVLFKDLPSCFFIVVQAILLFIFSPIFIIGYTAHIGIIRLPRLFNKHFDDRQFHSSVKFATTTLLFPIYYFLIGIIISKFIPHWYFQFFVIVGIALSGEFSYYYYKKSQYFICSIRKILQGKKLETAINKAQKIWVQFQNIK
jgi:1-acyl-sn-glycerol-3-phosphate acyltransferase